MLHIKILCVGSIKEKFYRDAVEEYEKRLSRFAKISILEVSDEKTKEGASDAEIALVKRREGERLLAKIKENDTVITLEISGKKLDSMAFSKKMQDFALSGQNELCFVIGGSLGLDASVRARSDFALSFSDMTFPHQLMRVILLEQMYRAFKILSNEPYHK